MIASRGQRKTHIEPNYDIARVQFDDTHIWFHLRDERVVGIPIAWSWRLEEATPEQRERWEIIGAGSGVHWPDVDEDISVRVLMGHPS